jgi:hypothetical protein
MLKNKEPDITFIGMGARKIIPMLAFIRLVHALGS